MILADQDSPEAAIWQLVESCGYRADLTPWSDLTDDARSVLDLGCGIGRVARHLAGDRREVTGVDIDPTLVRELNRFSTGEPVSAVTGSATDLSGLDLGRERFEAVIAPQQLLHIIGGKPARHALISGARERLVPKGVAAFAISEWISDESRPVDVLPDVREIGDWVYASRPVAVEFSRDSLTVIRLRQIVAPDGTLDEYRDSITLDRLDRDTLAKEIDEAGLQAIRTIEIPETDRHIASVIVVARRGKFSP